MFISLNVKNYFIWFVGSLVSNIGTNIQRTAQDWIVISDLTNGSATALGVTIALQFTPQLLLMPISGLIADKLNLKKVLYFTQTAQGLLAVALSYVVLSGHVTLIHVQIFAFLLGIISAIDSTARQTFVSSLVSRKYIINAVSLNSASFNLGRVLGPAVAGMLVAFIGAGWSFAVNGVSFLCVITSLFFIKNKELIKKPKSISEKSGLKDGVEYMKTRPDLLLLITLLFFITAFGFNFQIFISKMVTDVYSYGANGFGVLISLSGFGAVIGALITARRNNTRIKVIIISSVLFSIALLFLGVAPNVIIFALILPIAGVFIQIIISSINTYLQVTADPKMRGRAISLFLAVFSGTAPIGSLIVGYLTDILGPRDVIFLAGLVVLGATVFVYIWLAKLSNLRVHFGFPRKDLDWHDASAGDMIGSLMHFSFMYTEKTNSKNSSRTTKRSPSKSKRSPKKSSSKK
jgi:MFS family permease